MKPTDRQLSMPVTVEFEDVDSYRIAHHTKLVAYLERARVRFLAALGFDLQRDDVSIVIYSLDMQFKKTARFLDELAVSVAVESAGAFRLVLGYRITRGDDLIAKATTGLAFVEARTKEPIPVPPEFSGNR